MPARTTFTPENALASVAKIFDQAQNTSANHQKNFIALYKIHKELAAIGEDENYAGEKAFANAFINMLSLVLPVKKGARAVDRVIKFIAGYAIFILAKGMYHFHGSGCPYRSVFCVYTIIASFTPLMHEGVQTSRLLAQNDAMY